MTPEQAFYTRLTALAGMVQHFTLTKELLSIYDAQLAPLGYAEVSCALDQIIANRGSRDPFPSVKEIREVLQPETNPDHEALEAVSRIIAAISKFGPGVSTKTVEQARAYVGELGWEVVKAEGGWENVCKAVDNDNLGMIRAQWRNLAIAKRSRASLGMTEAPRLPSSGAGELKALSFGELMKKLPAPGAT